MEFGSDSWNHKFLAEHRSLRGPARYSCEVLLRRFLFVAGICVGYLACQQTQSHGEVVDSYASLFCCRRFCFRASWSPLIVSSRESVDASDVLDEAGLLVKRTVEPRHQRDHGTGGVVRGLVSPYVAAVHYCRDVLLVAPQPRLGARADPTPSTGAWSTAAAREAACEQGRCWVGCRD